MLENNINNNNNDNNKEKKDNTQIPFNQEELDYLQNQTRNGRMTSANPTPKISLEEKEKDLISLKSNDDSSSCDNNNSNNKEKEKDKLILNQNNIINSLKLKIQVLANGIKEDRQKIKDLEAIIKNQRTEVEHLEKILIDKEDIISNLTKEKYELELQYEKDIQFQENLNEKKTFTDFIGNIFKPKDLNTDQKDNNEAEIKKLLKEKYDLEIEVEKLQNLSDENLEDFNRCKSGYQNIINSQTEKMKNFEKTEGEKNKQLDELNKKLQIMYDNHKKWDVEKTKNEVELNELKKDKKLRDEKIVELLGKFEEKEYIINSYKESLIRHETENAELARKLAELKNAIIESNIVITNFTGERIGTFFNDVIELIFGRTEEDEYVMIIKDKKGDEYVDLEDIEYIKENELEDYCLDICYIRNKKQIKFTFYTRSYELSKIIQTYKDYLQKAVKHSNNLIY